MRCTQEKRKDTTQHCWFSARTNAKTVHPNRRIGTRAEVKGGSALQQTDQRARPASLHAMRRSRITERFESGQTRSDPINDYRQCAQSLTRVQSYSRATAKHGRSRVGLLAYVKSAPIRSLPKRSMYLNDLRKTTTEQNAAISLFCHATQRRRSEVCGTLPRL